MLIKRGKKNAPLPTDQTALPCLWSLSLTNPSMQGIMLSIQLLIANIELLVRVYPSLVECMAETKPSWEVKKTC
jgi:hypothetical protein